VLAKFRLHNSVPDGGPRVSESECAVRLRGTELSQETAGQSADSGVMRRRQVADTVASTSLLLANSGDVGVF
jgi:hypothetical protein